MRRVRTALRRRICLRYTKDPVLWTTDAHASAVTLPVAAASDTSRGRAVRVVAGRRCRSLTAASAPNDPRSRSMQCDSVDRSARLEEVGGQIGKQANRQPNHVGDTALDLGDQARAERLDRIAPRS